MGIATGVHNDRARVKLLQLHRLLQFEEAFSSYLEGTATASHVALRAKKMLQAGLPQRLK